MTNLKHLARQQGGLEEQEVGNEVVQSAWGHAVSNGADNTGRPTELLDGEPTLIKVSKQAGSDDDNFPSLEKAKKKQGKKKSNKNAQKVSLQTFQAQGLFSQGLNTQAIRMSLPSHSRERGPEEKGGDRLNAFGDDGYEGGRGRSRGGFNREEFQRGPRHSHREDSLEPSKADTVETWGSNNKFSPSKPRSYAFSDYKQPIPVGFSKESQSKGFGDYKEPKSRGFNDYEEPSRLSRRNGFGDSYRPARIPASEVDSVDNWQSQRQQQGGEYLPPNRRRASEDQRGPKIQARRPSGFGSDSRADAEDTWSRGSKYGGADESYSAFGTVRSEKLGNRIDNRKGYFGADRWSEEQDSSNVCTPPAPSHTPGSYIPPSQRKGRLVGARDQILSNKHQDIEENQHFNHSFSDKMKF